MLLVKLLAASRCGVQHRYVGNTFPAASICREFIDDYIKVLGNVFVNFNSLQHLKIFSEINHAIKQQYIRLIFYISNILLAILKCRIAVYTRCSEPLMTKI